jgi:hypothetical protein
MEVARWEKLKKEQLLGKGVLKMIKDYVTDAMLGRGAENGGV